MLCYFDLAFFSMMKLVDGDQSTPGRRQATIVSYIMLTFAFIVPFFLVSIACKRFTVLGIKDAKKSFNAILLKVNKASRWRLLLPLYFFMRRAAAAMLLSMPIDGEDNQIFMQYVFVMASCHIYVLFLVSVKPYQTNTLNYYILANEVFYSTVIISIFMFSDATPKLDVKMAAGAILIAALFFLVFSNFLMVIYMLIRGPARLKAEIKQAKLKRAEKELLEYEEAEERRQRREQEDEEFTRLPEDTTNMEHYDL